MENKYYITEYCIIEKQQIIKNDDVFFQSNEVDFSAFAKASYKNLGIEYPKFFKMDALSKLAFLASEILLNQKENDENIALLFSNKSSSLDTDLKHQKTIQDKENYFPSPAVFVYTLANICLGEVSIRHKLKTESAFFCFENYDADFMMQYTNYLLESNKATKVLCGWVDYINDDYKAVFYLVEKQGKTAHSVLEIKNIFK